MSKTRCFQIKLGANKYRAQDGSTTPRERDAGLFSVAEADRYALLAPGCEIVPIFPRPERRAR